MPRQWFVGRTKQGKEKVARANLENQGYGTYLPLCVAEWSRFPRIRPFLPCYIFINFDPKELGWNPIYNTIGMSDWAILTSGDHPQPISADIIEGIKEREEDGWVKLPPKIQCKYQKGERVKVKNHIVDAIFHEVKDSRRAEVFINLLGRAHKLIVPLSKLTTASVLSSVV